MAMAALRFLQVILFLPALICLYLAILFSLIRAGEHLEVTREGNSLLDVAAEISLWPMPDLNVALANYDRKRAANITDEKERHQLLLDVRDNWLEASRLRPGWPYYQIGALSTESVLAGVEAKDLQARFDQITSMAPNERGIDRPMFELGFWIWSKLRRDQQDWLVKRIESSALPTTVRFALEKADLHGVRAVVCVRLSWSVSKVHCKKTAWPRKLRSVF